mmetsp:Transcript_14302/g.50216  ORF Transcript_14302/g.50216 Transcript_14302/m.50216 type:complete len:340 (+) Transcript_14302:733-1752(+)
MLCAIPRRQESLTEVHSLRLLFAPSALLLQSGLGPFLGAGGGHPLGLPGQELRGEVGEGADELAGDAEAGPRQMGAAQGVPQHQREHVLRQRQGHDEALAQGLPEEPAQESEAPDRFLPLRPLNQRLDQQAAAAEQVVWVCTIGFVILHPQRRLPIPLSLLQHLRDLYVEALGDCDAKAGLAVELNLHQVGGGGHHLHRRIRLGKELLALLQPDQGALQGAQPKRRPHDVLLDVGQLLGHLLHFPRIDLSIQLRLNCGPALQELTHLALLCPMHSERWAEGCVLQQHFPCLQTEQERAEARQCRRPQRQRSADDTQRVLQLVTQFSVQLGGYPQGWLHT